MKEHFIVIRQKRKDHFYIFIAVSNGFAKGYSKQIGIGRLDKLEKIVDDPVGILKNICRDFNVNDDKNKIKQEIMFKLASSQYTTNQINYGIEVFYKLLDNLKIYDCLPKTKHKELEKIFKYIISSRIIQADSMFQVFKNKYKFTETPSTKKDTYYSLLDVLSENKETILKQLNEKIINNKDREIELVFYDSTTAYFESFERKGLRYPGYSKDGKFKEDQVVVGMCTDKNGIPIHYKLFKGNTGDPKTFIPFILEMKKLYNLKIVTIIADKGMSVAGNIRFLEQNNIDYIISYRLKSGTKSFKDYVRNETEYKGDDEFKYKEQEFISLYKNKRPNGKLRRKIITYSRKRAIKDFEDRQILINNFNKLKNRKGFVEGTKLLGTKKYRFFKRLKDSLYELDLDKVNEDRSLDGYYIYETSRFNLSAQEVVDIYAKQWQIEENFRTLKSGLQLRPMYVWTDKHIEAHFLVCFISLVMMKYLIYKINNFLYENGVKDHFTNSRILDAINSANKIQEIANGVVIKEIYIKNENIRNQLNDFTLIEQIVDDLYM
ncbi:IS1634 family transposase [Mycoplasma nasistruthionis]|nr:IS1634 family transposase [Mycoplasma nasistruthionis]